jgi:hypothetical protein
MAVIACGGKSKWFTKMERLSVFQHQLGSIREKKFP